MTIRATGSKATIDVLGAASSAATTVTDTFRTLGRVAQAGYAYTDGWATNVEKNAEAFKVVAGAHAEDLAIAWLHRKETEITEYCDTQEKRDAFKKLKAQHFPKK